MTGIIIWLKTIQHTVSLPLSVFLYGQIKFLLTCTPSLVAQSVKDLPAVQETQIRSLGQEDPLEKEIATHSSILAWEIPWTEKPGRVQSMGSQRVGHDWATNIHTSHRHYIKKWRWLCTTKTLFTNTRGSQIGLPTPDLAHADFPGPSFHILLSSPLTHFVCSRHGFSHWKPLSILFSLPRMS